MARRQVAKPQSRPKAGRTSKGTFARGVSGNPGGRPQNEKSISYWLKQYGNMSVALAIKELEAIIDNLRLQKSAAEMPWFKLVALRALQAMANEPSASMLREVMDRTEGRIPYEVRTWEHWFVEALKNSEVTPEWVRDTLGDELAQELFRAAGVTLASS